MNKGHNFISSSQRMTSVSFLKELQSSEAKRLISFLQLSYSPFSIQYPKKESQKDFYVCKKISRKINALKC